MTDTEQQEPVKSSMILYTDGSSKPNPGYLGAGFHGYMYHNTPPTKGSGNPNYRITNEGYILKTENPSTASDITPTKYIDGFSSIEGIGSNNLAELIAADHAINQALQYPLDKLLIKTDSEYLQKGVQYMAPIWIKNRWYKSDGNPVANASQWKQLLENINKLRNNGTEFEIKWVKGHGDSLGNNNADKLAGIGSCNALTGNYLQNVKESPIEKYWANHSDRHPMLSQSFLYFTTLRSSHIPGEYFLGTDGKREDEPGRRSSDSSYSVVQLKEPEHCLELIRQYQTEMTGEFDSIVTASLNAIYTKNRKPDLELYGKACLVRSQSNRLDLEFVDKEPITQEHRPPRLAMLAIEAISQLKDYLIAFKEDKLHDTGIEKFDITDSFYSDTVNSKKKDTIDRHLKKEFTSSYRSHLVSCNFKNKLLKINLTLGIDILDRNSLKKLEDTKPKVYLLVWSPTEFSVRYATIIHNENDYGIWAGVYSNLILH